MSDNGKSSAMYNQAQEIKKITAERDALKAQVERLRSAISLISKDCQECAFEDETGLFISIDVLSDAEDVLEATSDQCLAEVKAQAVMEFSKAAFNESLKKRKGIFMMITFAEQYTSKLLQVSK